MTDHLTLFFAIFQSS